MGPSLGALGGHWCSHSSPHPVYYLQFSSSKKSKKGPQVTVKPKPSPRLTIFDEEVDPDEGLFGPDRKLSPQSPLKNTPQDGK